MKIIIFIIPLLSGCYQEIDVQINPYACIEGFKWDLNGNPIVDDFGAQETCIQDR